MTWADAVGLIGVAGILAAYALLQADRLRAADPRYSLLNAAGAAGVLVSLIADFNLSAFLVEFFWLLISLAGLVKAARNSGAAEP
ncbi:MAG TPA: hypothetical protein P5571_14500 [Candidatus Krumholzibacteria bacterium]|nr:hypothetical protein [Candidatus Krumholzibacteria bacterium]HRX52579.1 hypothetical protein [Candidatus Krumholzibacteria bacterium]